jgi:pimeloyl-ACP methyl ester carboxylesterase
MSERPVVIPTADSYLVGDLAPGGAEAVVFLPGWGGTRYGPQRILPAAAEAAQASGFTTLRVDFRGRGDSPGAEDAATLDTMIADVVAAVAWLRAEQGVTAVHLVGICSGGNVALGAASQLDGVGRVICWSLLPFMEHKAQATRQGTPRGALLKKLLRKALNVDTWRRLLRGEASVGRAMQAVVKDKEGDAGERERKTSRRDILADLAGCFHGDLRLIYGTQDPEAAGSRTFFTEWCRAQRVPLTVYAVTGAPHNYYTAAWTAEVVAQTAEWLCESAPNLKP